MLGRRPSRVACDGLCLVRIGATCTDTRHAVDGHDAVRTVTGEAVETTTPVVLQRPRERSNTRAVYSGGDRVAVSERNALPFEVELGHRSASAVDPVRE